MIWTCTNESEQGCDMWPLQTQEGWSEQVGIFSGKVAKYSWVETCKKEFQN